ncbi:hypothetical protein [Streptomyces sp. NPDC053431]|uniref:hypothetical protein n=1 Tax=Streptomyces sp. NPDC053431 TaxID=3365703 RepID=UPI0037D01B13
MLLSVLVGCGSGAGAAGSLSVDRVVELAEKVKKDGSDSCPLPYDLKEAADAAELDDPGLEPGAAGGESDDPKASASGGKTTDPQSPWQGTTGALVTCSYHAGADDVDVHTGATAEGNAVYLQAPLIQSAGGLSVEELQAYTDKAAKAKAGEAVPTKGGNVVTVRLDSGGQGDVALVLTAEKDGSGKTSLTPEQVLKLAKTFAAQAE